MGIGSRTLAVVVLTVLSISCLLSPAVSASEERIDISSAILDPLPEVAVSADVQSIDFGAMFLGDVSDPVPVTIANVGSKAVNVAAIVADGGEEPIFTNGITINKEDWRSYHNELDIEESDALEISLCLSTDISSRGQESGTLVIWIEEQPALSSGDWPQWQRDTNHFAALATDEPVVDPQIDWTYNSGSSINVSPLIVGNIIYTFNSAGQLSAVNKDTGALIWKNTTDVRPSLQSSIPAYGDGKLFVATNDGQIYAFDAATGDRLWSVKPSTEYRNFECPITYYDHHIFIGEGLAGSVANKYYYCYDDLGNQIWKYEARTSGFIWGGAVVVGDYLVFPVFEGKLVSVYRNNGTVSDEVDLTDSSEVSFARSDLGRIRSSVAYNNGYIYSTSENGRDVGYLFKAAFVDGKFLNSGWSTLIKFSTSTPVVYGGRVYVGNGGHGDPSGNLNCVNDADGRIVWSYEVYSGVKSSPVIAVSGGGIFIYFAVSFGNSDKVFCIDGEGSLVWEYDPPDDTYILQGCTLSRDAVYFGTNAGALYCLKNSEAVGQIS